jgi:large subunit ribosomal protein L30
MATLLVKQVRSKINCPLTQKRGLEALGLRKMGQVVEHDSNPAILGMIKLNTWFLLKLNNNIKNEFK